MQFLKRETPPEVSKILKGTLFKYIERSVYITRPVREFIFTGYRNVLLDTVWLLSRVYPNAVPNMPLRLSYLYKVQK